MSFFDIKCSSGEEEEAMVECWRRRKRRSVGGEGEGGRGEGGGSVKEIRLAMNVRQTNQRPRKKLLRFDGP